MPPPLRILLRTPASPIRSDAPTRDGPAPCWPPGWQTVQLESKTALPATGSPAAPSGLVGVGEAAGAATVGVAAGAATVGVAAGLVGAGVAAGTVGVAEGFAAAATVGVGTATVGVAAGFVGAGVATTTVGVGAAAGATAVGVLAGRAAVGVVAGALTGVGVVVVVQPARMSMMVAHITTRPNLFSIFTVSPFKQEGTKIKIEYPQQANWG